MSNVRVRFAPSPTGSVHIGNIRAAVFNWLFARHVGGKFLLRIEDTDLVRSTKEAIDKVLDAMAWLGRDYDEPVVYQTHNAADHLAAVERLLSSGAAYKAVKESVDPATGEKKTGEVVLFRMPKEGVIEYTDLVKGKMRKKAEDTQDFVIVRSDGSPVFHIANVVDDIKQGVTHIIRGDDHVENTFKHIQIFKALGAPVPEYAHLPMIVNAQGKPYSKRDGAAFVGEFKEQGYLPEALFNFLVLLGWAPGDDREVMSRSELVEAFSLDRVKSSPARFDLKKLLWMNGEYIAHQPADVFKAELSDTAPDLRKSKNAELARFITEALSKRTELTRVGIDGKEYYLTGAPLDTLGWAVISVVDKELTDQPTTVMLTRYGQINDSALRTFEQGAKRSAQTILVLTISIVLLAIIGALVLAGRVVKPLEHMTRRINALSGSDQAFEMEEVYRTDDEIEKNLEKVPLTIDK